VCTESDLQEAQKMQVDKVMLYICDGPVPAVIQTEVQTEEPCSPEKAEYQDEQTPTLFSQEEGESSASDAADVPQPRTSLPENLENLVNTLRDLRFPLASTLEELSIEDWKAVLGGYISDLSEEYADVFPFINDQAEAICDWLNDLRVQGGDRKADLTKLAGELGGFKHVFSVFCDKFISKTQQMAENTGAENEGDVVINREELDTDDDNSDSDVELDEDEQPSEGEVKEEEEEEEEVEEEPRNEQDNIETVQVINESIQQLTKQAVSSLREMGFNQSEDYLMAMLLEHNHDISVVSDVLLQNC